MITAPQMPIHLIVRLLITQFPSKKNGKHLTGETRF
jgi:hypothetical protein